MSYIKVEKDLPNDPMLIELANASADEIIAILTGPDCHARSHMLRHVTLGLLVTLWRYADTYLRSDDTIPVTLRGLAAELVVPVDMLQRFPARWLKVRGDGTVELPSYARKNRLVGKDLRRSDSERREADRVRQQRFRERQKQHSNDPDVTARDRAVTSRERHATTGTGTRTYRPGPTAAGSLASAVGRLAIRPENGNGNGATHRSAETKVAPRERRTQAALREDVQMLTANGIAATDIARMLAQHGVTQADVDKWLAEGRPA